MSRRRHPAVCHQPGCPQLAEGQSRFCPEHARADNARRAAKSQAHGIPGQHWQRLRKQRLLYASRQCELHLDDGCTGTATTVHLDPQLDGDHNTATLEDLRAACSHCHGVADAPRAQDTRRLSQ
jgi:hypothetical protein